MRLHSRHPCAYPLLDRRKTLAAGIGFLAALASGGCAAHAARPDGLPVRQLGAITGNSLSGMDRFARWLGRWQDHDLLYFNQESWERFEQSIPYIVAVGSAVLARGGKVQWSIPAGGRSAYEQIADGTRDALYRDLGRKIAALYGDSPQRVCLRLFWEFNLPEQTLAAKNAGGSWDADLYVNAYRRIALLLRGVSDRFYFDWCPNIGAGGIDPDRCYPGNEIVDVISADIYYRSAYDRQTHKDGGAAIFRYRRTQPFGLDWLANFASSKGKLVGISEWGVDDDEATAFMEQMCSWLTGLGDLVSHHNYWDRDDGGVVSRLSTGRLPAIGAIYRKTFDPQ